MNNEQKGTDWFIYSFFYKQSKFRFLPLIHIIIKFFKANQERELLYKYKLKLLLFIYYILISIPFKIEKKMVEIYPTTLIFLNIYLILYLSLFIHWNSYSCGNLSNIYLLVIYLILTARIILHEIWHNQFLANKICFGIALLISSLICLALSGY